MADDSREYPVIPAKVFRVVAPFSVEVVRVTDPRSPTRDAKSLRVLYDGERKEILGYFVTRADPNPRGGDPGDPEDRFRRYYVPEFEAAVTLFNES